jgi:hypothetical protein
MARSATCRLSRLVAISSAAATFLIVAASAQTSDTSVYSSTANAALSREIEFLVDRLGAGSQ